MRRWDTGAVAFWLTLGVEAVPVATRHDRRGGTIGGKDRQARDARRTIGRLKCKTMRLRLTDNRRW